MVITHQHNNLKTPPRISVKYTYIFLIINKAWTQTLKWLCWKGAGGNLEWRMIIFGIPKTNKILLYLCYSGHYTDSNLEITVQKMLLIIFLTFVLKAGWVTSTMTSRASSSSWREESTHTGTLTVGTSPTTWSASCLCAPSTVLYVYTPKQVAK